MKLAYEENEILTNSKREESEFSFVASAKSFKIISDTLYSDKIRAIIRELCTNMLDSHIEAGKADEPFEISFPSIFDPHIYFRDYGTGMSHSNVMKIMTKVFESTKDHSNDYVGALGLGSKSPMSYTDQFIVDSWYDGEHNSYSVYIGDGGTPRCKHLSNNKCDLNETGMKITIPVKNSDCKENNIWFTKAKAVLPVFKTLPKMVNLSDKERKEIEDLHSSLWETMPEYGETKFIDDEFNHIFMDESFPWYVVMGSVVYPVSINEVGGMVDDKKKLIESFKSYVKTNYRKTDKILVTHAHLGDVSFAPSREHLDYNQHTLDFIVNEIEKLFEEIETSMKEGFVHYESSDEIVRFEEDFLNKYIYVPEFISNKGFDLPTVSYEHANQWLKLSLDKKFPEFKDQEIKEILSLGGFSEKFEYEYFRPNNESETMSFDVNVVGYYGYTFETIGKNWGQRVSFLSENGWFENPNVYFPDLINSSDESIKVLIVDSLEIKTIREKAIKYLTEYSNTHVSNKLFVLSIDRTTIQKMFNIINFYKHSSERPTDYITEQLTIQAKKYKEVLEWVFNGKVAIWSEVKSDLEKNRREELKSNRDNDFKKQEMYLNCINLSYSSNIIDELNEHTDVYYIPVKRKSYKFENNEVDYDFIKNFHRNIKIIFNWKRKVFLINKSEMKMLKKHPLSHKLVNFFNQSSMMINKFIERNQETYALTKVLKKKYDESLINVFNLANDKGEKNPLSYMMYNDKQISKHVSKFNDLKEQIFNEQYNLNTYINRSFNNKWYHFINYSHNLRKLNYHTKSNDFLPKSKLAKDLLNTVNTIDMMLKHNLYQKYPLLKIVMEDSEREFTENEFEHMKKYISCVDNQ